MSLSTQEQGKDTASSGESALARTVFRAAQVLHDAHRNWNGYGIHGMQSGALYRHFAERLAELGFLAAGQAKDPWAGQDDQAHDVPPLIVYRVDYDGHLQCGLYSNIEAARAHCEGSVSDDHPADTALFFEWCVVEEDSAVIELDVRIGSESASTLYTVTTLTVDSAFDPDADS